MEYWDKNPKQFRIIVSAITALILALSIVLFYKNASSTTDENTFGEVPSHIYINKSFPAALNDADVAVNDFPDTVRSGTIILEINGSKPKSLDEILESFDTINDDGLIQMTITNFKGNVMTTKRFTTKKSLLPEDFIITLPNSLLIFTVVKDGASDRAGILPGDIITKINGSPIKSTYISDKILRSAESGSTINYQILREGKSFDIQVTLAQFGVPFGNLIMFINSIIFLAFGAFIALSRPNIKAARLLGIAFILVSRIMVPTAQRFYFDLDFLSVIQYMITVFGILFGFAVLYNSTAFFPTEKPEIIKNKWWIRIPYIVAFLCLLFLFYLHLLSGNQRNDMIANQLIANNYFIVFLVYILLSSLIFRKHRNQDQKDKSKIIFRSVFAVVIIFILVVLVFGNIFNYYLNDFFLMTLPIIPLSYIYTIGRYRLLDLDIRVKRNIQYSIISLMLKVFVAFLVVLSIWLFAQFDYTLPNIHLTGTSIIVLKSPLKPEAHKAYENGILMLFAIFSFVILWKSGKKIQDTLDKKFYRTRFDYKRASKEFSDILAKNIGINELATNIVKELSELIHLRRVGIIFIKDEEKVVGQAYYGFKSKEFQEFCSATGKALVDTIKEFHGTFCTCYLHPPMKDVFESYKLQYIVPIESKRSIVGAFIIGEKLSEMSFHSEDMEFMASIAGQTSVAIENSFLYEALAQQERIKHELSIARRIQLASLPQSLPDVDALDISGISLPALEVGGDFYDYLNGQEDSITVIVGDVSGKGTSAALYMSKIQGIIRTLNDFSLSPKDLFVRSNQLITKYLEKSSYITAIAANFDIANKKLSLARAGHLPIYYYNQSTKQVERIIPKGILLGMTSNKIFEENMIQIEFSYKSGDVFLFVTDGVVEARSFDTSDYGEDRLIDIFKENISRSSSEIRDCIIESIGQFTSGIEQFDDLTIVVIKAK
jgi:serine phosphatase RsbU (regulator of sigma subunit)